MPAPDRIAAASRLRARRRADVSRAAVAGCGVFLGVAGWWALRPLEAPPVEPIPDQSVSVVVSEPRSAPLELRGFGADLWPRPARTAAESQPPPPPPPRRIQLLGITSDGPTRWLAAIYDPETDRVTLARVGDRIGPRSVTPIGPQGIGIRAEHESERTVPLRRWGELRAGAGP